MKKRLYELFEKLCLNNDLLFMKNEDGTIGCCSTKTFKEPKIRIHLKITESAKNNGGGEVPVDLNATETENNCNEQKRVDQYVPELKDLDSKKFSNVSKKLQIPKLKRVKTDLTRACPKMGKSIYNFTKIRTAKVKIVHHNRLKKFSGIIKDKLSYIEFENENDTLPQKKPSKHNRSDTDTESEFSCDQTFIPNKYLANQVRNVF
ncbi:hypothetical protein BpHYR1_002467 [Brachionus plicatilis]|uniref:Uncharacterized protein n=1 Tax=Brachionus plicatilis TaxID=10195 RepID=A0A3M7SB00_BRAPC|nr:hypothetical protein BpHYR1_002467 [Brachionus plicatilis]